MKENGENELGKEKHEQNTKKRTMVHKIYVYIVVWVMPNKILNSHASIYNIFFGYESKLQFRCAFHFFLDSPHAILYCLLLFLSQYISTASGVIVLFALFLQRPFIANRLSFAVLYLADWSIYLSFCKLYIVQVCVCVCLSRSTCSCTAH